MTPTVSIIVAAYNASLTIAETIESVLSQTFSDLELIIVDDGSTDETRNIVSGYERKDCRVKYTWQDNSRASAARNRGLAIATGKYISIIDADDLWDEHKLEKQMSVMDSAEDTIVLTGIRRFQVLNRKKVWGAVTMPPEIENDRYDVLSILLLSSFQMVLINTALIKRDLVEKLGGWKVDMWTAEDWEFWIRASRKARFKAIGEPLSFYRKHAESVTRNQDMLMVLNATEKIVEEQLNQGVITKKDFEQALICRQIESCGFFIYQGELAKAIHVLRRSLSLKQGWANRNVWRRGIEVFRLAVQKITT
jgi:glycosyltransferase involved in cell wall biosynthesis